MPTEANYVAGLALRWARTDALEQWVNAAPQGGPTPLEESVTEYLGSHNPFADGSRVEVLGGYTLVRAARNATAHITSQGVDDGQESMSWDRP